MIVSVVGGSSRWVSGDITLGHRFNSFFLLSLLLFTPPRSRSEGDPFRTSICVRYRSMTERIEWTVERRAPVRCLQLIMCVSGETEISARVRLLLHALWDDVKCKGDQQAGRPAASRCSHGEMGRLP